MSDDTKTIEVTIPANKTFALFKNLKRLNKKAAVQRAGKFEATLGEERTIILPIDPAFPIGTDYLTGKPTNGYPVRVIDVTVTGPSFSIGGYDLVCLAKLGGELRQYSDLNNAHGFTAYDEIDTACQHCNTHRNRVDIFILRNTETGEYLQVGKTCLKDFTGYSPADALKGAGFWEGLGTWEEEMLRATQTRGTTLLHLLACAIQIIDDHGYVSRSQSEDYYRPQKATADRVAEALYDKNTAHPAITDELKARAIEVRDWAAKTFASPDDAFTSNVHGILEAGYVPDNMTGFAACLPALKQREEERARLKASNAESQHFGEIGKRMEAEVEVVGERFIESDWGGTTLFTLLCDGNVAKWFASNGAGLEVGLKYRVKMTVKKHDEFNGTKQTVVNRIAVQDLVAA